LNSITSIVGGTLPGVTVSNPGTAGVWITVSGVDQETSQSYAIRCQNRWPSLGIGATPATYDYWARTASPNVTRTRVFADAVTPGQVDVYLAGAAAPVAAGDVTAVQSYVDQRTPLTAIAVVSNATAFPINVAATVTVKVPSTRRRYRRRARTSRRTSTPCPSRTGPRRSTTRYSPRRSAPSRASCGSRA
jgi:uncharacterized phage protein gp47/JayE